MNCLKKKNVVAFIITGIFIAVIAIAGIHMAVASEKEKKEEAHYQHALDIWIADPDSIQIISANNTDITEVFFNKYGEQILAGNCREAIVEMKENKYEYLYTVTHKNQYIHKNDTPFGAGSESADTGIGTQVYMGHTSVDNDDTQNTENYIINSEKENSDFFKENVEDDFYAAGPAESSHNMDVSDQIQNPQ